MTQANTAISPTENPAPSSAPPSHAVLVLGMHRSGTSALARVLNLLGVELGTDLLPPAADNEMGFWEHRQVQFIHDRVYEVLKADWTNVSALPARWWELPEIEPYRQQLRETLERDFGNQPLWGIKDPRLCAMLPLWRPLLNELNVRPTCVLICRNPTEVAKSLAKRDGMSLPRAYLLWLRSMIDSERGSRGLPRTITTFDQLLVNWTGETNRISLALDVHWPKSADEITEAVGDFLRPSARHHQIDDERFLADPQIPALVRQMYAAVLSAAASGEMSELAATVDTLEAELDRAHPLLSDFIRSLEQEHRSTIIEKNLGVIRLEDQTARHQATTADAAEKARHIAELQQQLQQCRAQLEEQSGIHTQLRAQLIDVHAEQMEQARAEMQVMRVELEQYRIQHIVMARVLAKIKHSLAWRWTAALRIWPRSPLTDAALEPVSEMEKLGPNHWACRGQAQMVLPCLPVKGNFRIELKLTVSVAGHAYLHYDTGNLFNSKECLDLGPVEGETTILQRINLPDPTHCFRLDPLDRTGEFKIHHFRIQPIREAANPALNGRSNQ